MQVFSGMKNLRVVFLSHWLGNPYKTLLSEHLLNQKVEVTEYLVTSSFFLPLIFQENKLDIVHLHLLHEFIVHRKPLWQRIKFCLFIIQISLLKIRGIKVVWTVHEWHDKIFFKKDSIPLQYRPTIGKFIDAIITHCHTTQQEIIKAFSLENQDKVFIVPHGNYIGIYENNISKLEARKALGIPAENLVLLLFGGIYRYKGVLETIDAFKHLEQDGTSLLIAGQPHEEQLEELIKDKIQGFRNILFVPKRVPDDEVQIYLNASDCVLVPYQVFTTSGVAILAMSFGQACVAPRVGFFTDVLDESGAILYDSTDEEGLLKAMTYAIEKKSQLWEMGKYNLKMAEKWNWSYVAEETFKIYQRCLTH